MAAESVSESVSEPADFRTAAPTSSGSLEVSWRHGVLPGSGHTEPAIQVHRVDDNTFVLRQSKAVDSEAPFLYLLLGSERAVLFDTGATGDPARFPLREVVDKLIAAWLATHRRTSYELVVAHTHGHRDHVAGDAQFAGRPDTTVVGTDRTSVADFFGFSRWPDQVVTLDLGGRVLEITGIPGHQDASLAILDPRTGFLLTGDTVYPGRLYVEDLAAFTDSLDRLVGLAQSRGVRAVMGCHIEMSRTPGVDYLSGTTYQPDEPALQMSAQQLGAVRDAALAVAAAGRSGAHVFDDFVIVIEPG
jgi:glyoxylase-like metal-dependent hydrolase (beta-lactamase superfamily II)